MKPPQKQSEEMKVPGAVVYHLCIVVLEDLEDPPFLTPTTIESFTFLSCATHATSGLTHGR